MSNKDKALNSETFCLLPFIHMATKTDGDMKLCCRSWPVGNINETTMKELWNSDKYKEVRRMMLNGERPKECDACWRQEDIGCLLYTSPSPRDQRGSRMPSWA